MDGKLMIILYAIFCSVYIEVFGIQNNKQTNMTLKSIEYSFWFTNRPNCINITTEQNLNNSQFLYHLPTHEGLASQFHQLEYLWSLLNKINLDKTIIQVPFSSHHYKSLDSVSECNVFKYPKGISCSCNSMKEIVIKQSNCVIMGHPTSWSSKPKDYKLSNTSKVSAHIDLKRTNCIAGQTYNLRYNRQYYIKTIQKFPLTFQDKYENLTLKIISLLTSNNHSFVTAHWRRGDQICLNTSNLHHSKSTNKYISLDTSINCGTVYDYINEVQKAIKYHLKEFQKKPLIYIATNENNKENINVLHHQGYITSKNITKLLKPYHIKLNSLDIFVIEMILMCKSKYNFHWGRSGVHDLITRCRNNKKNII